MKKRNKKSGKALAADPKRQIRITSLFSEDEQRIVDRYLEKYKITNRSRWVRETLLSSIHKRLEDDYPTLFDEHDMRR